MSKRRNRNKNQTVANNSNNVSNKPEIDYDKLAQSIIKAHLEIDKIKIDMQKKQEEKAKEERKQNSRKLIGYKEYPDNENVLFKILHSLRNFLVMLIHFIFFKKENVKSDSTTYAIIQTTTSGIYGLIKWVFYTLALVMFLKSFLYFDGQSIMVNPYFVFEIENIEDRNYMFSIFTGTTSFFAMLLALISLFKG